jgi:hypothetical protein
MSIFTHKHCVNVTTITLLSLLLIACGKEAPEKSFSETPSGDQDLMILTTNIPVEIIEGTPQPIKVANLEKAPTKVPKMRVPTKTKLLSAGKTVTGSDDFPIIGELAYLTDGDKDAGEGYFVELMDGLQWVQIDLESESNLEAIWLWHYHSQARAYHDIVIQISNDSEFVNNVTTLFNNDFDNSAQLGKGSDKPYIESRFGKLINAKGIPARYVRLYSNGNTANDMNHYIEVEVYGN